MRRSLERGHNRGAGRIESELWDAFLHKCKAEGLSNTDRMAPDDQGLGGHDGARPPVGDAGSAADVLSVR